VLAAIDRLVARDPSLDVRRLTGSPEYRIRVGDWRVRFALDTEAHLIVVQRVLPRGRAYDR
jgi:mRNA-degrading endonuclease RelE of RelBE toxin-antitoxin system